MPIDTNGKLISIKVHNYHKLTVTEILSIRRKCVVDITEPSTTEEMMKNIIEGINQRLCKARKRYHHPPRLAHHQW